MRIPNRILVVLFLSVFSVLTVHAEDAQPHPTLARVKAAYQRVDASLNSAYHQARSVLPEDAFKKLQDDERLWIHYRDFQSKLSVDPEFWRDKGKIDLAHFTRDVAYWRAMSGITLERTKILQFIVACHQGKKFPLTGRWSDGYGGEIRVVETPDAVAFDIEVVRGPTFHIGNITGFAHYSTMSKNVMAFSDGGKVHSDSSDRDPAILVLRRTIDRLVINGINTRDYCGARAYFGNDYYRIGDLTKKEQAHILKVAKSGQSSK